MNRQIINIDEEKCNGCGDCIPNCHEGALRIIDGKARLVSDLLCDGLGACIGHCPLGAISLEEREALPYDEIKVMKDMAKAGENTILAHLNHLKEHGEKEYLNQGINYLWEHEETLNFSVDELLNRLHESFNMQSQENPGNRSAEEPGMEPANGKSSAHPHQHAAAAEDFQGCPGSKSMEFNHPPVRENKLSMEKEEDHSALSQWPVQLHLINPAASFFNRADVLLAADCVAYSMGNFHKNFLNGKKLAIACPKLDSGKESYLRKLTALIDQAKINTLMVMMMEVPCCSGLLQLAQLAVQQAGRKVPVKAVTVSIQGKVLAEQWV